MASMRYSLAALLCMGALVGVATAGEANVTHVQVRPAGVDLFSFDVTVEHADEGWDHYADAWEVVAPNGDVLGVRTLFHPHVDEQPFTRSLGGVYIPPGVTEVTIRARDSVHGFGGLELTIQLPR